MNLEWTCPEAVMKSGQIFTHGGDEMTFLLQFYHSTEVIWR
jgi:hypothetical protein